ncbi:MAG: transcription initiation factor IIB, partial [Candidatus Lokiarchaeota archaeon]|nr:transcription initiation factor IIB [Candidatus Lokiarchaeota archaeon]
AEKLLAAFEASNNTAGKDPKGMIAAAIYLASKARDEETAQKRVSIACGVTEVTLRSRIKEFAPILSKLPTS